MSKEITPAQNQLAQSNSKHFDIVLQDEDDQNFDKQLEKLKIFRQF